MMKFLLSKSAREAVVNHFVECFPLEACGFIVDGNFMPCQNIHEAPLTDFKMSGADIALAYGSGAVQAVVHSHPNAPSEPTWVDRKFCYESAIPWGIFSIGSDGYHDETWIRPEKFIPPLIGRPFVHGVFDCCSMLLDYYSMELGIEFEDFPREDNWWNKGQNLYIDNLPKYGFEEVRGSPRQSDIILMQIKSPVPNHGAIYLEDGLLKTHPGLYPVKGCLLHHTFDQDSRRVPYGGMWLEKTVSIWRLKN